MGPILFPPGSPDLTPLDFFVWAFLQQDVYCTEVASLQDFRSRLDEAIVKLRDEISLRAVRIKMNLFFIYDTSICNPDDDPSKAMIYFYPMQELESESCMLYYQIIGIAQFLQATFSSPSVVTLEVGSFVICRSKHYLLVLRGSKQESIELLKTQLRLMCKVFSFYHSSITEVFHVVSNHRQLFKQKMNEIWTLCLSVVLHQQNRMQLSCHSLPVIVFPQDDDLKTIALLNMCQVEFEVLAGAVFYHKILLYTQFFPDITSALSLVAAQDNGSGINVPMKCKLPPGVKLKYVYLTKAEMTHLQKRRCKLFPKGRRKPFHSFWSNSGSEGDVESDSRNYAFNHDLELNEPLQSFRLSLSNHYRKGLFRMYCFTNLPCSSHQIKPPFPGIRTVLHQSRKECCDLEFQCLVCKEGSECLVLSKPYLLSALKRWNSETDVMYFRSQQRTMSEVFSKHLKKGHSKTSDRQKRLKSLSQRNSKPSSLSSQETDSIGRLSSQKSNSSQWSDFFYLPFSKALRLEEAARRCHSPLLSSEELHQECVLYIQRYSDSSLILLLSSIPSTNMLVYLWYCGFTFLPSISYNAQRKCKHYVPDDRSDFNIYTYKYHSNVLDGKLPSNMGVPSDNVKATIHEDFYSDPLLYSISITDPKRSICAYNTKEKQIFYEQFGRMHRKLNWFSQFWERASRRTEKYLNISLPKF